MPTLPVLDNEADLSAVKVIEGMGKRAAGAKARAQQKICSKPCNSHWLCW